jgi:hypothetical protein
MKQIEMLSPNKSTAKPKIIMCIVSLASHFRGDLSRVDAAERESLSGKFGHISDDTIKFWVEIFNDVNAVGDQWRRQDFASGGARKTQHLAID